MDHLQDIAVAVLDSAMAKVLARTNKKAKSILPDVMKFATDFTRPLVEKIDPVHYTQVKRALRLNQDYCYRLLQKHYDEGKASLIAHSLLEHYADHDFVIDFDEAEEVGLHVEAPSPVVEATFFDFCEASEGAIAMGLFQELEPSK